MGIMGVKMLITVICDGWGILQLRIINGRIERISYESFGELNEAE